MENTGEHIVGQYLQEVKGCEFVQYNLQTKATQGEIDVVAINLSEKKLYICEVAIHLKTGLQYTKDNRPDNVNRLVKKFNKNITYSKNFSEEYTCHFMLWTPIIKIPKRKNTINNQLKDLFEIQEILDNQHSIKLELVYNEKFLTYINELRAVARKTESAMTSSVMRFLQIEEKLKNHLKKIEE